MISTQSINQGKFMELIKKHLQGVQQQSLSQLGKKLFPIMSHNSIWASLYNCFHTFYTIRINKGERFQDGTRMILKYAEDMKDQQVLPKIKTLLQDGEFTQKLSDLVARQLGDRKICGVTTVGNIPTRGSNQQQQQQQQLTMNMKSNINSNINISANIMRKNYPKPLHNNNNNISNIVDISDDSPPTEKQSLWINGNGDININGHQQQQHQQLSSLSSVTTNKIQITQNNNNSQGVLSNTTTITTTAISNNLSSDPYDVPNLSLRQVCLCGKSCQLMQPKKDLVFKCCHCNQHYHIQCMQRGRSSIHQTDPIKKLVSCAYCHLKDLVPMKQVMKTLFVGVLRQGRKRHQIVFNLDMMDLKTRKWRVQVRCFRLKQKIQTFVLFPDSASFSINNRFQKQFLPLPKQSSLKYRKDQPFLLTQHLINHQNKLTIIQRIPKKESRDDRIQPQNHLIGIYLVQDRQVATLVKNLRVEEVFTFYQAKAMLERCLRIGDVEDITCEVLKIPIICTLTIQRIKTPVRGVFCSHFQCFDLNNFLVLTSTSANPRWTCPLCKQPAYRFKYDIIIGSIIEQYSKHEPTEIMFTKDGQFKVYSNQKICPSIYSNINDLPIDNKYKRQLENPISEENLVKQASERDGEEHKIEVETTTGSQGKIANDAGGKNGGSEKKPVQNKSFQIPQDANIISLDDD